ncbi:hypothetical protein I302_104257 [Kwoniella bestiolae CBS 10118]|uniref:HAD phosphatase, family IIIA n=1 Tax=Kwoniella bestiolae CBS 10118 TaxID=1296100 RepID=A0A1B9GAR1_9TREE|nr:hypothetical protein I302_02965 [Kwoniella bestiolae CBS 10118]OCF28114.1 hypothetical protein I302_02965 [Kwoniella bestiolae CBS 10118]
MPPIQLPNILIYLTGVIRPKLLRPHVRVASIAQVDFRALRKEGYNAVVVDKDNCLTIPNKDDIHPPYQTAWNDLLDTFDPGRVLIVSNSAGTRKDPGGIAAESVSLSLRAPILIHSQNKPGCSKSILQYFNGQLGQPITNRRKIVIHGEKVLKEEREDETMLWERWEDEVVEKPLLGYNHLKGTERTGDRVVVRPAEQRKEQESNSADENGKEDGLKMLVIGDRLFTDTLLAHRLSLHLPKIRPPQNELPSVLSIYTTSLPQPKDVRILRWIEERLSKSKTKPGNYDRFVLKPLEEQQPVMSPPQQSGLVAGLRWFTPTRWREFDQSLPPITIHPRSWKPLPVAVGLSKSIAFGVALVVRYSVRGVQIGLIKIRDFARRQFELAQKKQEEMQKREMEKGTAVAVEGELRVDGRDGTIRRESI